MKKQVKCGLVLVLVLVLLCSLCGCKALDEMRKQQVFLGDSGEIFWNGSIYKPLPYNEYLAVDTDFETVYVTNKDVPVLLSSLFFEKTLEICTDRRFLLEMDEEYIYYCQASAYDAICARLELPFEAEILCYWYSEYNDDYFDYKPYTLTDEEAAAINQVKQTTEPKVMETDWLLDYDWSVALESRSADMLLCRNDMEIAVQGDTYYLLVSGDEENLVYTVPAELNDIFVQLLLTYTQSEDFGWMTDDEFIIQ